MGQRLLLLLVFLFAASGAHASSTERARQHYKAGKAAYAAGEYLKAAEEFKEAYSARPDAALLFNIAQIYAKLNERNLAKQYYINFLQASPKSPLRSEVEKRLRALSEPNGAPASAPANETVTVVESPRPAEKLSEAKAAEADRRSQEQQREVQAVLQQRSHSVEDDGYYGASEPLYKKWYVWTPVAAGVVVIALGVGLGVGLRSSVTAPSSEFGIVSVYNK